MKLKQLFKGSKSRSESVATFLAVLELIREHRVRVEDDETVCMIEGKGEDLV